MVFIDPARVAWLELQGLKRFLGIFLPQKTENGISVSKRDLSMIYLTDRKCRTFELKLGDHCRLVASVP